MDISDCSCRDLPAHQGAAPADSKASVIGPTAGGRRQLLSSKDVHICVSNSKAVKIVFVPAQVSSYLREFGQRSALLCYR